MSAEAPLPISRRPAETAREAQLYPLSKPRPTPDNKTTDFRAPSQSANINGMS
jgi:hypothetical protein